jgi:hypothetical protein
MSSASVTSRSKIVATLVILLLAALAWFMGNRIPTTQPVSVAFRPVAGSAEVEFLPQPWANSPICSCNAGWKGIGVPADQFDLDVGDGEKPWTVMVGPIDRSAPANWWLNPSALVSPLTVTVAQGEKKLTKFTAPAGITIESSGSPIGVFTTKSSFSTVIPADGSTTTLRSEPMMASGEPAGMSSVTVDARTTGESASDYDRNGTYVGAHAGAQADVAGSNFRGTMIDTLGPRIELTLGALPNSESPAGTYRLWVGDREVELPNSGDVQVSIRTDFAVRFRPLPFDHLQVIGGTATGSKFVLPQVTQSIPSHRISLANAFTIGGDSWEQFVARAKTAGPPIELPDTSSLFVYGSLSRIGSSAMQGTVSASGGVDVAPGDRLELTSGTGFNFTTEPLLLLAATAEQTADSQYLYGRATGSLRRSESSSGLDGLVEKLRGPSVTRTRWLINVTPFVAAFAGFFTVRELLDALSRRHGVRAATPSAATRAGTPASGPSSPRPNRRAGGAGPPPKQQARKSSRKTRRKRKGGR